MRFSIFLDCLADGRMSDAFSMLPDEYRVPFYAASLQCRNGVPNLLCNENFSADTLRFVVQHPTLPNDVAFSNYPDANIGLNAAMEVPDILMEEAASPVWMWHAVEVADFTNSVVYSHFNLLKWLEGIGAVSTDSQAQKAAAMVRLMTPSTMSADDEYELLQRLGAPAAVHLLATRPSNLSGEQVVSLLESFPEGYSDGEEVVPWLKTPGSPALDVSAVCSHWTDVTGPVAERLPYLLPAATKSSHWKAEMLEHVPRVDWDSCTSDVSVDVQRSLMSVLWLPSTTNEYAEKIFRIAGTHAGVSSDWDVLQASAAKRVELSAEYPVDYATMSAHTEERMLRRINSAWKKFESNKTRTMHFGEVVNFTAFASSGHSAHHVGRFRYFMQATIGTYSPEGSDTHSKIGEVPPSVEAMRSYGEDHVADKLPVSTSVTAPSMQELSFLRGAPRSAQVEFWTMLFEMLNGETVGDGTDFQLYVETVRSLIEL